VVIALLAMIGAGALFKARGARVARTRSKTGSGNSCSADAERPQRPHPRPPVATGKPRRAKARPIPPAHTVVVASRGKPSDRPARAQRARERAAGGRVRHREMRPSAPLEPRTPLAAFGSSGRNRWVTDGKHVACEGWACCLIDRRRSDSSSRKGIRTVTGLVLL